MWKLGVWRARNQLPVVETTRTDLMANARREENPALPVCDKLNRRLGYGREAWTAMAGASMKAENDDPESASWH